MAWEGRAEVNGQPAATGRTYADEEWARTSADPLTVTPSEELVATRNRDGLLLGVAVLVIVAVLAWLLGRAS